MFATILGTPRLGRAQTTKGNVINNRSASPIEAKLVGNESQIEPSAAKKLVTQVVSHKLEGRHAATIYIRQIPVLTFLGQSSAVPSNISDTSVKTIASLSQTQTNDPIHKANLLAERINQLVHTNTDASKITVNWKGEKKLASAELGQNKSSFVKHYKNDIFAIKTSDSKLVEIDQYTVLAGSTKNLAEDALQITNRLRRLIGYAPPVNKVENLPVREPVKVVGEENKSKIVGHHIRKRRNRRNRARRGRILRGWASWYGYDGSGNRTATGERYNPEGLTAAHRSLPFGTRVRVTNTRNGRSVVVRINDRGPFIRGRIIDVSAGAARRLRMISSGVAPVRVEVINR
ncbi:septal ring lytic transglycosylase RlpA family protein [Mastigocoleus testarum]|nr:septal ring lytic transglycosylase RlpA family protein [Mastigocoleus testarum]